jgi:RNA polymerase sigma factor (TIGR02999 family)
MDDSEPPDAITRLLGEWRAGDQDAANRLMELVYSELHQIASREMRRENAGHTLQTTALVHEAYVRLCGSSPVDWRDRSHFFAVAARQLRRVLVDHARRSHSDKRGGGMTKLSLWDSDSAGVGIDHRLLALDEALERLEALDARAAQALELRFYGGLSEAETAEALEISLATMKRDWDFARTWLAAQLA